MSAASSKSNSALFCRGGHIANISIGIGSILASYKIDTLGIFFSYRLNTYNKV